MSLDAPVTIEELHTAIKSGKPLKAPGGDGICQEFYKLTWKTTKQDMEIMNQMHSDGTIKEQQKHGIIVCIPKKPTPNRPEDYRALTLLNADLKLMARIIASRLHPWLTEMLHPIQHCGVQGNTILDAIAIMREAIAYAESTEKACVLYPWTSKRPSMKYHTHTCTRCLRPMDLVRFQKRIKSLYEGATASVQINGHIPIKCSIRQGCPLSMQLYALCLNPFLRMLDEKLNGIRLRHRSKKTTVVAYADVTILVTSPNDIQLIKDAITCYQEASGAQINLEKSKAMAMGVWDKSTDIMGIQYHNVIKILGVHMHNTIAKVADINWATTTGKIRTQAHDAYNRDLCLEQRIQYTHNYLLTKAWYIAQIFPLPKTCERQLNTAIAWYIWHGEIFKVPLSTLQRPKVQGGWDLINTAAKSRALYYYRLNTQGKKDGTLTAEWLRHWDLHKPRNSPPPKWKWDINEHGIPASICNRICVHRATRAKRISKGI
jgi:hypothetical protein